MEQTVLSAHHVADDANSSVVAKAQIKDLMRGISTALDYIQHLLEFANTAGESQDSLMREIDVRSNNLRAGLDETRREIANSTDVARDIQNTTRSTVAPVSYTHLTLPTTPYV